MSTLNENKEKLKKILTDMFQFDQADLDFGIYRIMNQKRAIIADFMNRELFDEIAKEVEPLKNLVFEDKCEEIDKDIKTLEGLNDEGLIYKINELKEKKSKYRVVNTDKIESEIYSHITEFFRRYYDEGDFISQRRYKDGAYGIPYEGEEVKLYWANFDQYYVKSSEYFTDYIFDDKAHNKVHFKLLNAKASKDNNKENGNRTFQIITDIDKFNENVLDDEKKTSNPEIIGDVLTVYFVYTDDNIAQKKRNEEAYEYIKNKINDNTWLKYINLLEKKRKLDNSEFEKQLNRYTARNTYDYFIHKNLKGFLEREIDFYIKNEVLHLEDMDYSNLLKLKEYITKAKIIEKVSKTIINFLSQMEEFQKTLWLKKKFVVASDYCITLDKIDEKFYRDIVENKQQIEEWKKLFAIEEIEGFANGIDFEFLKKNPYLVLDTKFYDKSIKDNIIGSIDNLDEEINGVLINSDNFHALNLLQEKYRKKIDCVYIDPPYNANSSEIMYKNNFKNSSWLSLMENRISKSIGVLKSDAVYVVAIDEVEQEVLGQLLTYIFGENKEKSCITVVHNPSGQQGDNFSFTHEFAYFLYNTPGRSIAEKYRENEKEWDLRNFRDVTGESSLRNAGRNCYYPILIKDGEVIAFGEVLNDNEHPKMNEVREDDVIEVYPIDPNGIERKWRFERNTVVKIKDQLRVKYIKGRDVYDIIRLKKFFNYKSTWVDPKYSANNYGTQILNRIIPNAPFKYPKSIYTVTDCLIAALNNKVQGYVLDYFAGSGTTGHAVINLNREDNGNRKYILVEMGEYFNTVTKPRIEKVIYSKDWKNGKPVDRDGISQIFKYMTLESYDDALNNIEFVEENIVPLFQDMPSVERDYMLSYMLPKETEDSKCFLTIDALKNPFEYSMKITEKGEIKTKSIDLIETFNYLIGLKILKNYSLQSYDADFSEGEYGKEIAKIRAGTKYKFKIIEGLLPTGEATLVIWRNLSGDIKKDNIVLNAFLERKSIKSTDFEYKIIYVNGDNFIKNTSFNNSLKVKLIEDEMKTKMFEEVK